MRLHHGIICRRCEGHRVEGLRRFFVVDGPLATSPPLPVLEEDEAVTVAA
eukprot:CAMPEP_0181459974 /NCGR_PEP_ID=MMETSP1110-20121109/33102_1 /TAXON_ID=174948 /ORGANISM="Symbiodinium sp., Strain CCMP421" /LENGTH=49 /DNA_ID=CAMNT_0023584511 /DNA_START=195 /DNA_END=344 /DNA_ORIENTATION=+